MFTSETQEDFGRARALEYIKRREPFIFYPNRTTIQDETSLLRIEKNLYGGKYAKNPWNFIKHVNEAFEQILDNNGKKSRAYQAATLVQKAFDSKMDSLMVSVCFLKYYKLSNTAI